MLLLAGLLVLMNWLGGRYLSSLVDQQLQQIAATDDQLDYRYQSLNINPLFGSLTISEIVYRDHKTLFEADEARGSLTWADMWRVLRHGSDNPLSQIRSFRLTATSLTIHSTTLETDHSANSEFTNPAEPVYNFPNIAIKSINLLYNGRMDELLKLTRITHPPHFNHRINISLSHVSAQNGVQTISEALPVLSGYLMPDNIDRINFQIRYRANKKTAQLSTLRIHSPKLTIRAGGDIRYDDVGWPNQPESYSIYYQLNSVSHDLARINLPGILGGFSMDTLSVTSQLQFDREAAVRHPLALPGETTLYMGGIQWFPSSSMIDRFGIIFGMFGLSEKQLPVRSLRSTYHITHDTLRIDDATIHTEPFDARIHMLLATPPNQQSNIQEGSVTFIRTGAKFDDFVDGLEDLFRLELPRKDGQLYFEFSGDPGSPDFNFDI